MPPRLNLLRSPLALLGIAALLARSAVHAASLAAGAQRLAPVSQEAGERASPTRNDDENRGH
jgi:hypothetical protein